ncbi:TRAP transporter small permease subunit [Actibacterium sp. XHP0104]|uniref:TRAP transporter small permease subunit n=1 Tax=Actibacterium sp. XHP0104 TaxID=2984335 RepID=UPI0021E9475B|nr:TRAP transporter small permease subunit [Actibacterium sp. XHP0104]MCV2882989.1 TRAP transporter small permease subunit [Actibacterium sp. XHP0104]
MNILLWIDRLNLLAGRAVSYVVWIGAAILVWEVVSRYAFGNPTVWAHGYTQRIFASYFILIGAYTLLRGGHVRVDLLLTNRGPRALAFFDAVNYAFLLIWTSALTYEGWNFFQEALLWSERDDSALAHPLWPVKLVLVVAAGLIALQAFAGFIRSVVAISFPSKSNLGALRHES